MSSRPQIISSYEDPKHTKDLEKTLKRLSREGSYKDLSTIILIPTHRSIAVRVVASWWNLIFAPNNKTVRLFVTGMEVGAAYSETLTNVLNSPELSKWKYVLFLESDNAPPSDGVVKLLEQMEAHPEFAAIGGLYFTKGPKGVAQIWGDVNSHPLNFRPQLPVENQLIECNGTGMGFTLMRLDMFKDKKLRRPWFKTLASKTEGIGTQDLYFWTDARKFGYRCAIDCSVKVGHFDEREEIMW